MLVSEVMLQQTQVARVVPRFEAWLERWPTPADLAAAPAAEVLAAWVGLGYNRRALRLREACAVVAARGWPEDLRTLPGVGPYTAAAVAAFARGQDVLPVDTNVRRVLERTGLELPGGPLHGQAVMELGALVCRAREAACPICPLRSHCASAGAVAVAPRLPAGAAAGRTPFRDTNRWVRGRVVAALAAGEPVPDSIAADRLERAVQGLLADGLVKRGPEGLSLG